MLTRVAALTVSVAVPETPLTLAVIVVEPTPRALASPVPTVIVATLGFEDPHVTAVTGLLEPSL